MIRKKGDFQLVAFWAVFDCDEHPRIAEALAKATSAKIGLAYSNPCFELWAVLHFKDHDAPSHRHKVLQLLRKIMPSYGKSKCLDYGSMRAGYSDADRRAQRMENRREEEGAALGNPFTGVFKLTRIIKANGRS